MFVAGKFKIDIPNGVFIQRSKLKQVAISIDTVVTDLQGLLVLID